MIERTLRGCAGGAFGALSGHLAVVLAHRWTGNADIWIKGPHGPPFFDLALSTAFFYACLGGALFRSRLPAGTGIGFGVAFATFVLPMMLATYLFSWGEGPAAPQTWAWVYMVLGAYSAANLTTAAALGFWVIRPSAWRRAACAAGGAVAAYVFLFAAQKIFPSLGARVAVIGYLAPPFAVYSGAFWGAAISLGTMAYTGHGAGLP